MPIQIPDTAPAFVSVGRDGWPTGHATRLAALDAYALSAVGRFVSRAGIIAAAERQIEAAAVARFIEDWPDMPPTLVACFDNRRARRPLASFANRHLDVDSRPILAEAAAAREDIAGPRVGDYVRHPDGDVTRLTYDWGDGIQAGGGRGSFHLFRSGGVSYSGGLSGIIPRDRLRHAGAAWGAFWIWKGGLSGAHRGVTVHLPCRLYAEELAPCPA